MIISSVDDHKYFGQKVTVESRKSDNIYIIITYLRIIKESKNSY